MATLTKSGGKKKRDLIYIANTFPTMTETFVYNEIEALDKNNFIAGFYPLRKGVRNGFGNHLSDLCLFFPNSFQYFSATTLKMIFTIIKMAIVERRILIKFTRINILSIFAQLDSIWHAINIGRIIETRYLVETVHLHAHFAGRTAEVCKFIHDIYSIDYSVTVHAADIYAVKDLHLTKWRLANAEFLVSTSYYLEKYIFEKSLLPKTVPIHVIHYGIDTSKFKSNVINRTTSDPLLILSVGRVVEKKGFKYLLDAAFILKERISNFKIVIIGDGPLLGEIKRYAAYRGCMGVVNFVGWISNDDVNAWYKRADIFVLACARAENGDMDGIPNVLMEAMASGVPTISTFIAGIPELIDDEYDGILVEPQNGKLIADAIFRISQDDNFARRLAILGREKVIAKFNLTNQTEKLMTIFSSYGVSKGRT